MKKLLLLVVIVVVGKVAYDRALQSPGNVDAKMTAIAAEMNRKLPMSGEALRMDSVEYSGGQLRFSATLLGANELNAQLKTDVRKLMLTSYCGQPTIPKAGVGIEYVVSKTGMRGLNDKLSTETWSTSARPGDCA